MWNMDQTLLNDLELDVQELKYLVKAALVDKNQALSEVAKRSVLQMRSRLDLLYQELSSIKTSEDVAPSGKIVEVDAGENNSVSAAKSAVENVNPVIAKPVEVLSQVPVSDVLRTDLRHSISLNDSFRFTRELFRGDSERMNKIIRELDAMKSLDEAMAYVKNEVDLDESNETALDFVELLKKRFN